MSVFFATNAPKGHLGVSHEQNLYIGGIKNAHFGAQKCKNLHFFYCCSKCLQNDFWGCPMTTIWIFRGSKMKGSRLFEERILVVLHTKIHSSDNSPRMTVFRSISKRVWILFLIIIIYIHTNGLIYMYCLFHLPRGGNWSLYINIFCIHVKLHFYIHQLHCHSYMNRGRTFSLILLWKFFDVMAGMELSQSIPLMVEL